MGLCVTSMFWLANILIDRRHIIDTQTPYHVGIRIYRTMQNALMWRRDLHDLRITKYTFPASTECFSGPDSSTVHCLNHLLGTPHQSFFSVVIWRLQCSHPPHCSPVYFLKSIIVPFVSLMLQAPSSKKRYVKHFLFVRGSIRFLVNRHGKRYKENKWKSQDRLDCSTISYFRQCSKGLEWQSDFK